MNNFPFHYLRRCILGEFGEDGWALKKAGGSEKPQSPSLMAELRPSWKNTGVLSALSGQHTSFSAIAAIFVIIGREEPIEDKLPC